MRVLLTIEYDGTNYSGWQAQKNALSIQETIEDAILRATGERVHKHNISRSSLTVLADKLSVIHTCLDQFFNNLHCGIKLLF